MAISFDRALGIHPQATLARSQRAEVLATNIANADTPNYKARDIDFSKALEQAKSSQSKRLVTTHEKHFDLSINSLESNTLYRIPNQPDTGDGNTVDMQLERGKYVQNAMEYQASINFLGGKFKGLKKALGGQGA
jgi:flagellar basal-body rod protein FlgB